MIEFACGFLVGVTVAASAVSLCRRPAPWWKAGRSGRIRIDDLRHDESGDSLLPVDALRIAR